MPLGMLQLLGYRHCFRPCTRTSGRKHPAPRTVGCSGAALRFRIGRRNGPQGVPATNFRINPKCVGGAGVHSYHGVQCGLRASCCGHLCQTPYRDLIVETIGLAVHRVICGVRLVFRGLLEVSSLDYSRVVAGRL